MLVNIDKLEEFVRQSAEIFKKRSDIMQVDFPVINDNGEYEKLSILRHMDGSRILVKFKLPKISSDDERLKRFSVAGMTFLEWSNMKEEDYDS